MIHKFRNQHPLARLYALVDVAKSGYQAWCTGKVTSPRKLDDMRLVVAIKAAHQRGRGIYGVAARAMVQRRSKVSCSRKALRLDSIASSVCAGC